MRTVIASILAAGLAAAALTLAAAGTASASPRPLLPVQVRAVTYITDRPDSGNGGAWADDTFTRILTITPAGGSPGHWAFTATLDDEGSFTAVKGALTPDQGGWYAGDVIQSPVSGLMLGSASFSFTASSLPAGGYNTGVIFAEDDHGLSPADSTSTWYEQAFPAGTVFGGPGIGAWSWTYTAIAPRGFEQWADASGNGSGNLPGDGNITG